MGAQTNVEHLIRKTKQYEFADGLRDLQLAALMISMGLTAWFVLDLPDVWLPLVVRLNDIVGPWARWTILLVVLLPALLVWGLLALMNTVRRRWLWRESGMVKPSPMAVPRRITVLSAVILAGSLGLGYGLNQRGWVDGQTVLRLLWAATGWSLGYTLIGLGQTTGLARYRPLGLVGGLASTLLLFLPVTFGQAALLLGLGWGLALGLTGIAALRGTLLAMQEARRDQ